jgi:hypothetical protein
LVDPLLIPTELFTTDRLLRVVAVACTPVQPTQVLLQMFGSFNLAYVLCTICINIHPAMRAPWLVSVNKKLWFIEPQCTPHERLLSYIYGFGRKSRSCTPPVLVPTARSSPSVAIQLEYPDPAPSIKVMAEHRSPTAPSTQPPPPPRARGLHSSTSQLNLSRF